MYVSSTSVDVFTGDLSVVPFRCLFEGALDGPSLSDDLISAHFLTVLFPFLFELALIDPSSSVDLIPEDFLVTFPRFFPKLVFDDCLTLLDSIKVGSFLFPSLERRLVSRLRVPVALTFDACRLAVVDVVLVDVAWSLDDKVELAVRLRVALLLVVSGLLLNILCLP